MGAFSSCQSRAEKYFYLASEKSNERKFLDAVDLYERSAELEKNNRLWSRTNLEIARLLRLEIQDYNKALLVYRELILKSEDASVRLQAQENIAEIYFENIQDYVLAIKEYLLLESLVRDPEKLEKIRLKIAQGYRYTGNLNSALEYIDIFIKSAKITKNPLLKLRAQILQAKENFDQAMLEYNKLLQESPTYFKDENLYVAVAILLEEKEDYAAAINYLKQNAEKIKDSAFLELRLKRLYEKQKNKPFQKGVRK